MVISELQLLIQDTKKSQAAAFAQGTMDNLVTQWVKFLLFCVRFGLKPVPVSEVTLAWYAQFLSRTFKSHASIVNYLSGVKTLHLLLECDVTAFSNFLLKLTLRGLRWLNVWTPHQALPMDPTILINIRNKLNLANPMHATFWAACLVSFFLLLRKSNVVAESAEKMDLSKQLCRQDLKWFRNCI